MNKVILKGRIANDLELRTTGQENISILNFRLAVNRDYKDKDGNYPADFINCSSFKNNADFINKYFNKGDEILVEGKIQNRNYEAQDGTKRYVTEVIIEHAEFTNGKKSETTITSNEETEVLSEIPQNVNTVYQNTEIVLNDNDLPF